MSSDRRAPDDPDTDPPAFAVTQRTPTGEVRVSVWPARDGGEGRPLLVCCHGWTESGTAFGPLAAALGHRWTVIAPDAPGHGGTPWRPAPRFRVAEHAAGALAVLDRLPEVAGRRADIVVLGHGMGALTACRLAASRPGVVRHLVLEEPSRAVLRRSPSAATVRQQVVSMRALGRDGLVQTRRGQDPPWPADEVAAWARGVEEVSLDALAVPVDWGEPLVALLADVPCSVTLVHGTLARGGIVSPVAARRCAAACRGGCEVVPLPCGHHPRREAREPFIAVVAAALGRQER